MPSWVTVATAAVHTTMPSNKVTRSPIFISGLRLANPPKKPSSFGESTKMI